MATAAEKKMLELMKNAIPSLSDLQFAKGKYSRYDAWNEVAIVELKDRRGPQYEDTFIEKAKYKALKEGAQGRVAVYAVQSAGKVYVFNINWLYHEGYDFKWHKKFANKTTDFGSQQMNRVKVEKEMGCIDWDRAAYVIDSKTGEVVAIRSYEG